MLHKVLSEVLSLIHNIHIHNYSVTSHAPDGVDSPSISSYVAITGCMVSAYSSKVATKLYLYVYIPCNNYYIYHQICEELFYSHRMNKYKAIC